MDGDSLPHLSEIIQRYFTPHFQRLPIGDSDPSLKVDGMHRNLWTTSSGFTGRHASESVVDINRNHWSTCTGIRTLNPKRWIRLCDGTGYGGDCKDYRYLNNDKCIDLNQTGMSDRSESLRFYDGYVGNFDVIAYGDSSCQVYNARYGEETSTFGNLNNQFSLITNREVPIPCSRWDHALNFYYLKL